MREDRENILLSVLSKLFGGSGLVSMKSNDLKGDHNKISRTMKRMGVKDSITIAKDPDKGYYGSRKSSNNFCSMIELVYIPNGIEELHEY